MKAVNLRIEYLNNPLGVDIIKPRFSWELISKRQNDFQTAYQILVSEDPTCSTGDSWDSGKVVSGETVGLVYDGKPLQPDTKYYFTVKVWDNLHKASAKSQPSYWVTGFLGQEWEAEWITPQENDTHETETSPLLRKEFCTKKVERATLFIYSYGLYELSVNGEKADDRQLSAAWSDTQKKQLCDVYDLTAKMTEGQNAIGIWMGDGYNQNFSEYASRWTGPKRLIAQLHLHYADGSVQKVLSDGSWKCCLNSPILFNHMYNGECYDARYERDGWNSTNFDDSNWKSVRVLVQTKSQLLIEAVPPVRITEFIKPKRFYQLENGRTIFDFGQNFAGFVRIKVAGQRGNRITIRYAEEIFKHSKRGQGAGTLDTTTNRLAKSTDVYIFKDEEEATYQPRFTYHGFRYVEITGIIGEPTADRVLGCALPADLSADGDFRSSNQTINRIYQNARWSIRSNNMSYPTDCPVRDERTPCLMDVATYEDMSAFCFDVQSYFGRWLKTIRSDVKDRRKGAITPCWSGEQVTLTWLLYTVFGDIKSVEETYPSIKKYISDCLWYAPDMCFTNGFGDWCAPNKHGDYLGSFAHSKEVDIALFYWHLILTAKMAKLLQKDKDEQKYLSLAEKCKEVYHQQFFDQDKHHYSNGAHTPNILALKFGMVPKNEMKAVQQNLIHDIEDRCGGHLHAGIFGTRFFPEVLADMGQMELAVKCLCQKTYPAFGHQIKLGATTLWEQWSYKGDMNSHNHAMFAGVGTGFFTKLAGIAPLDIAYKKIQIQPLVPKSIDHVATSYHTVRGTVKVEWSKKKGELILQVQIPANCTAEIILPDGTGHSVGNGKYQFKCLLMDAAIKEEMIVMNAMQLQISK